MFGQKGGSSGLNVALQLLLMMIATDGAKEPPIAGRATIGALKQYMAQEPIFHASASRTEESFAPAMGALGNIGTRSGFVHGKVFTRP
jgi:hypothetical protein